VALLLCKRLCLPAVSGPHIRLCNSEVSSPYIYIPQTEEVILFPAAQATGNLLFCPRYKSSRIERRALQFYTTAILFCPCSLASQKSERNVVRRRYAQSGAGTSEARGRGRGISHFARAAVPEGPLHVSGTNKKGDTFAAATDRRRGCSRAERQYATRRGPVGLERSYVRVRNGERGGGGEATGNSAEAESDALLRQPGQSDSAGAPDKCQRLGGSSEGQDRHDTGQSWSRANHRETSPPPATASSSIDCCPTTP
jgi:hypothetical protein